MALSDAWGFDGLTYSGKEMRELVGTLTDGTEGVTGATTALAVSQQTVATNTVKVAEGGAVIIATAVGEGGSYQVYNDADLTSPVIAPTAANGRKDRLILRVTAGVPALEVVQGVASGSPAEPSITGDNYLELALITLPASTTNITDAMITDRRVFLESWNASRGVVGSASRATNAGPVGAIADIGGLSVTWTADSTRRYRTTVSLPSFVMTTDGAYLSVSIRDGSSVEKHLGVIRAAQANDEDSYMAVLEETGLSGSVTRKVSVAASAGSVTVNGSATRLQLISVEDVGRA